MKVINVIVTVFMVVQPVGTPSLLGTYLALGQTATDAQPASSDSTQPASTSADQPKDTSTGSDTSTPAKDESGSKTDPTGSGSATDSTNTTSNEPSTDSSGVNAGTETPNPADTSTTTDTSQPDPTSTTPSDTSASGDTSSNAPATDTSSDTSDSGTISPDAASTDKNTTEENGKICLKDGADIVSSAKSDWDVSGDTAETKGKVELGVKYVFPLNDNVSVTFTCLPASSTDRTTLKIQQIKSSDINLPDGVSAATDYAYDITTGMKDGDFEYDLTLPGNNNVKDVYYIEKSADEVKDANLSKKDLNKFDGDNIKKDDGRIEIKEIDHFTVVIATTTATSDLFFSEYIEGSSDNKALEIYNPTGSTINLSTGDYKIELYFNGSSSVGQTIALSGSVSINDVYVLAHNSADSAILLVADQVSGNLNFNGDDAVVLKKGSTILDVIGRIGSDPGSEWGTGGTTTKDHTLVRKCAITGGDTDGSNAFDPSVEWDGYANNTFSHLGSHSLSCVSPPSWPTSWTTPNSCVTDPSGEASVSPTEVDLVGNTSTPAVGFYSDSNYFYFRERINGNPGSVSNLSNYSWVVLFQTSSPQYQYLTTISGKNGNRVLLYDNLTHSPDSGGVDFSPLFNDPADNIIWEGSSSDYGRITSSGGKYYIDWAIPLTELTSRGINVSTTKFFATSTNANNYNKDHLQCYEAFADLSIVKSDSPDPVINGGTLTYTLDIHNAGPDTASGVVVTDTLPTGYAVTSITPSQGSCSDVTAPSIQCELGSMANGANATITITGTIVGLGIVTNTTSVALDETVSIDTNPANNTDSEDTTINPSTGNLIVHKIFTDQHSNSGITINVSPGSLTQVTDSNGDAAFNNLAAGTYSATATEPAGYYQSATTCSNVSVTAGQIANCTITDSPILGTITVHKDIIGTTTELSQFCFTLSSDPSNIGQICADNSTGNAVFNNVSAGTYSVNETLSAPNYTEMDNTCSNLVIANNGDSKSCAVTNTRNTGTLRILKNVDLNGDGDYTDLGETGATNWKWQANAGVDHNTGDSAITVDTGNYVLTETAKTDFHSVDLTCENGTLSGNTVTITKDANVVCTFTNARDTGTLEVIKMADYGSLSQWYFSLDTATPVQATSGGIVTYLKVPTGSHSVVESGPTTDFDLDSITCNKTYTPNLTNKSVSTVVAANETTQCTFNNLVDKAQITITKNAIPNSSQVFGFTSDITGHLSFNLDDDGDNSDGISSTEPITGLLPGTYSVSENQPVSGWDLGPIQCTLNGQSLAPINGNTVTRTLSAGDALSCTFTNTERGSISGHKWEDLNGDGVWQQSGDGTEPPVDGLIIYLDNNGNHQLDAGEPAVTSGDGSWPTGYYEFPNLLPGSYTVCEKMFQSPWWQSYPAYFGCHSVTLNPGDNITDQNFGNYRWSTISGHKWNDLNGNGIWDGGEQAVKIDNLRIRLWQEYSPGMFSSVGDAAIYSNGYYEWSSIIPGTYWLSEYNVPGDWRQTHPDASARQTQFGDRLIGPIVVTSNSNHPNNDFGNQQLGKIIIEKQTTPNTDTTTEFGFTASYNSSFPLLKNMDTNDSGYLTPGNYTVAEIAQTGWDLSGLSCTESVNYNSTTDFATATANITLDPAEEVHCTFDNTRRGTVTVTKFNDEDSNGNMGSEPALSDWGINLAPVLGSSTTQNTDTNGQTTFANLVNGNYLLYENLQPGWDQTNIYCEQQERSEELIEGGYDSQTQKYDLKLGAGETRNCFIGNHFTLPMLQIQKSNNKFPVDQAPGSDVLYTLTITALDNDVNGVIVTDLPPAGFVYRSGSWTASSSVRGDIKNSPTTEPNYASPGTWNLGDMKKDEVVTLTYVADIGLDQESGSYPDLAWTSGKSLKGDDVLGVGTSSHFVQDAFVGTEVAVVRLATVEPTSVKIETDTDTEHKDRKTVRKTVTLPATGASPWWLALAVVILLTGAGFILAGKRKKKEDKPDDTNDMNNMTKFLVAGLIGFSVLFGAKAASAATTLAAQMETPKSPYQTTDFNLGFVALDINGNPVTVQCFLDGSATPFQTLNIAGGGGSGNCSVNSSVISGAGTYQFHITATNGSESITTPDVSVDVILGGPGTPTNYDRDKTSACRSVLTFTTADDGGKTVRAEIYRSTERTYTADASTLVTNINAGSNQPVSYEDIRTSNCDTVYYAVRAFDALGNGSGVVADERTVVRTTGGGTRTITTTVTVPGGAIPAGGAVAGIVTPPVPGGAVAGEETAPAGEEAAPGAEEGVVLGEEKAEEPQSFIQKNKVLSAIIALVVLVIIYYAFTRKKKTKLPGPPQNPTGPTPPAV